MCSVISRAQEFQQEMLLILIFLHYHCYSELACRVKLCVVYWLMPVSVYLCPHNRTVLCLVLLCSNSSQ